MTETMGTTSGGTPPTSTTSPASTDTGTRDVAKEEARSVAQDAAQSGKQTVDTAKQQAGEVASEAMSQARQLLEQTREQVTAQGTAQQEKAASGLRSLADELTGMASGTVQQQGLATDLARQAAERIQAAADFIETRQPTELLDEVRRFARRRPGAFLLGAAAVGFFGGRLTRGLAAESRDDSGTPLASRTAPTAGLPANSPTNATGVPGAVQSTGGYASTGTAGVTAGVSGAAPVAPGYSVPPETDPEGDATAQFTPTDSGGQRDQMPSEFGARGTNASGNRAEEGTF
jgi:vacuolar-type H+-ATPase subunit H